MEVAAAAPETGNLLGAGRALVSVTQHCRSLLLLMLPQCPGHGLEQAILHLADDLLRIVAPG